MYRKLSDILEENNLAATTEAVGEFAEPLYTLQADLGLEDNILVDELARWMSGQDIADFVADFRSDHDMNENVKEEKVTEGTWSIPDTPEKVRELKDLMKQELPADEAQDKIYGILGDDELFDDIAEMEEKDPKADVRGMIVRRLDDLGLIKKKTNEEKQRLDPECWDGYKKDGTKMKNGTRVNNCVKK